MAWTISDGTTTRNIFGNGVLRYTLRELDEAQFSTSVTYTEDTKVTIANNAGTVIFRGYVKESEQEEDSKYYKLTVLETAIELKDTIVTYSSARSFIRSGQTVRQLVNLILTGTGWTAGTTDTTVVTSLGFYNTNALSALFKLVQDMQGKNLWFIDNGTTKVVYWGTQRTDRTATPVTYTSKKEIKDSNNRNLTRVTVYGADDTLNGTAYTGAGTKERIFRYATAKTSAECSDVATKLLADLQNPRRRFTVNIMPNYIYEIGDLVSVDSVNYAIRDIETTQSRTILGIGAYDISYQDLLGSKLEEIKGTVATGTDAQWSGGNSNVAANYASATNYIFDIKDVSMIPNAKIDATISAFVKSANVATETERLSDVSNIQNTTTYTGTSSLIGYSTWYLPDGTQTETSVNGIDTTVMANGYQFGMLTVAGNFAAATGYPITFQWIKAQASDASSPPFNWSNVGAPFTYTTPVGGAFEWLSFSTLIDGSSTTESTTARVIFALKITGTANQYKTSDVNFIIQRVPRHLHSVTTTYDKTTTGTPPATIYINVNGNGENTLTPGTPINIQTNGSGWLITGRNVIAVKTPMVAGNQCSVNPTITYQTLGKS